MLSKFRFFENRQDITVRPQWREELEQAVRQALGPATDLTFVEGGTLGLCAHLRIGTGRHFLKTHLPDIRFRQNLVKEIGLLSFLYGDLIGLEQIALKVGGEPQICMLMDELVEMSEPMEPDKAAVLIKTCADRLADYPSDGMETMADVLEAGEVALAELVKSGQIESGLEEAVAARLALLRRAELQSAICHGDYGPRNIMAKAGEPVVIDWEDAFAGVAGYDYLYWLSFMQNRQYYPIAFGKTPYGREIEVAILGLVVTLKSALSVRSGEYLRHSVSIADRIRETIALDR